MTDDSTPYCVEGCGRPATTSRPLGVTQDGIPTVELVCDHCANATTIAELLNAAFREAR